MDLNDILSKTELIVFDMDGVLADTEPIYLDIERELMGRYGKNLSPELVEMIKGRSLLKSMEMILNELEIDEKPEDLVKEEKRMLSERIRKYEIKAVPCSLDLLKLFSKMGYRMALATSTEWENAITVLSKLGIMGYFECVVTGDQVKETKPDPEIYLKVARDVGVDPERCLVLEDSLNGVKSARNAGMKVIAVNVAEKFRKIFLRFTPFVFGSICELLGKLRIRGVVDEEKNNPV